MQAGEGAARLVAQPGRGPAGRDRGSRRLRWDRRARRGVCRRRTSESAVGSLGWPRRVDAPDTSRRGATGRCSGAQGPAPGSPGIFRDQGASWESGLRRLRRSGRGPGRREGSAPPSAGRRGWRSEPRDLGGGGGEGAGRSVAPGQPFAQRGGEREASGTQGTPTATAGPRVPQGLFPGPPRMPTSSAARVPHGKWPRTTNMQHTGPFTAQTPGFTQKIPLKQQKRNPRMQRADRSGQGAAR